MTIDIRLLAGQSLQDAVPRLTAYVQRGEKSHPAHHPLWLMALRDGLGHVPQAIEAVRGSETVGYLPLTFVRSTLFGRYLVSMPYLNTAGIMAEDTEIAKRLVDVAVEHSQQLRVKHLELRHELPIEHESLNGQKTSKVHMRLELPSFPGPLWSSFSAKVRNQVRKGEKSELTIHWGGGELLDEFYSVFARNMRDLGTPVYSKKLFGAALHYFPGDAELCIVRKDNQAIAGSILVHGKGITEVPSASCLREFNNLSANMLMYWNLIDRAIARGQAIFDFGRATKDGNTYKFKKQWGAVESPAVWQYAQQGKPAALNADNPKYERFIKLWQRLPVPLTKAIGPTIVRGIP